MGGVGKRITLWLARWYYWFFRQKCGVSEHECEENYRKVIRLCYLYFMDHQLRMVRADIVLICNAVTTLVLSFVDMRCGCWTRGIHTWWLLNTDISKVPRGEAWGEGTQNPSHQRAASGSGSSFFASYFQRRGQGSTDALGRSGILGNNRPTGVAGARLSEGDEGRQMELGN